MPVQKSMAIDFLSPLELDFDQFKGGGLAARGEKARIAGIKLSRLDAGRLRREARLPDVKALVTERGETTGPRQKATNPAMNLLG